MDRVVIKDKTFVSSISHDELMKCIDELADKINADYKGCDDIPVFLCILNGAVIFTGELMQRINFPCQMVSTKLTSYSGTDTNGDVQQALPLTHPVKGRRVIIVEDVVDTGYTIRKMKQILKDEGAAESRVCTMLFKPDAYRVDEKIDYVGKRIPNDFIVGFGLDYDELGRNLKDIYTLEKQL